MLFGCLQRGILVMQVEEIQKEENKGFFAGN